MNATSLAILILCFAGSAFAENEQFTIPLNTTRVIGHAGSFGEDCKSNGDTVMRVTTPPQHGTASIKHGLAHTTFPATNPRNVCNAKTFPQTLLSYKPERSYVGDDSVSYEVIYPDGKTKDNNVAISVK